jgi:hypothetical protein
MLQVALVVHAAAPGVSRLDWRCLQSSFHAASPATRPGPHPTRERADSRAESVCEVMSGVCFFCFGVRPGACLAAVLPFACVGLACGLSAARPFADAPSAREVVLEVCGALSLLALLLTARVWHGAFNPGGAEREPAATPAERLSVWLLDSPVRRVLIATTVLASTGAATCYLAALVQPGSVVITADAAGLSIPYLMTLLGGIAALAHGPPLAVLCDVWASGKPLAGFSPPRGPNLRRAGVRLVALTFLVLSCVLCAAGACLLVTALVVYDVQQPIGAPIEAGAHWVAGGSKRMSLIPREPRRAVRLAFFAGGLGGEEAPLSVAEECRLVWGLQGKVYTSAGEGGASAGVAWTNADGETSYTSLDESFGLAEPATQQDRLIC